MKTQHTPGPWHVYTMGNYFGINSGSDSGMEPNDRTIVTFGDGDDDLCGVRGDTNEEMMSNAILIAAAPDLLSDAENLIEAMNQKQFFMEGYRHGSASISEVNEASAKEYQAYSKLFDTINKAKGL